MLHLPKKRFLIGSDGGIRVMTRWQGCESSFPHAAEGCAPRLAARLCAPLRFVQVPAQAYPGRQLILDVGVLLGEGCVRMLQLKTHTRKA